VQGLGVGEEGFGVEPRDLPRVAPGASGPLLHLVLAVVGIADEVPDVSDVHDVLRGEPVEAKDALEDVLEDEGPEVADVLVSRRWSGRRCRGRPRRRATVA